MKDSLGAGGAKMKRVHHGIHRKAWKGAKKKEDGLTAKGTKGGRAEMPGQFSIARGAKEERFKPPQETFPL